MKKSMIAAVVLSSLLTATIAPRADELPPLSARDLALVEVRPSALPVQRSLTSRGKGMIVGGTTLLALGVGSIAAFFFVKSKNVNPSRDLFDEGRVILALPIAGVGAGIGLIAAGAQQRHLSWELRK